MKKFEWIKENEVVAEDGTMKVVELENMYLSENIRLSRRTDTMKEGTFSVERKIDGVWEVEADMIDLKLVK